MALRDTLIRAAEALEKQAAAMDAAATEKTASQTKARETLLADVARRYEDATGEPLSDDVRAKLASSDEAVADVINKIAGTAGGSTESLGEPARDRSKEGSDDAHLSREERKQRAYDRFGTWITGGGE